MSLLIYQPHMLPQCKVSNLMSTKKKPIWENIPPLPDVSRFRFAKAKKENSFFITRLVRRARYVETLPDHKRTTNDRMDMVAWNLTWRCLKRSRPAMAKLLSDPNVIAFVKAFNAEISFEL